MSKVLVNALKWGGPIVVVVFMVVLYYVGPMGPYVGNPPPNAPKDIVLHTNHPLWLYWILMIGGVVAAIVGNLSDRSKSGLT